jgi:hypothetical protein
MLNNARSKADYEAFFKQDQIAQEAIKAKLEAPIKAQRAKEEFERTANNAATYHRRIALGLVENAWTDPSKPFIDPSDEAALVAYNRQSAEEFAQAYIPQGWYPSAHNREILMDFFFNRGIYQISAREFAAAYKAIKREPGIFEEKPIPVQHVPVAQAPASVIEDLENLPRLPLNHKTALSYKKHDSGDMIGYDPATGRFDKVYTPAMQDQLSASEFKRVFNIPSSYNAELRHNGGR